MLLSGEEVGYGLSAVSTNPADEAFLAEVLGAIYIADDAKTFDVTLFGQPARVDDGSGGVYAVVFPDVVAAASGATVIVQLTLDRQTDQHLHRFEAAVRRCPEVRACYLMTGVADYQLRVEARNAADYERIHKEQLSRMPGVARIQSSFAIRAVIRG